MLFNQLIVLPTSSTLEYFSRILSGSPLMLDLTKVHVEINTSQKTMVPEPDRIYKATAGSGNVWYDTGTGVSSWIIPLISDQLQRRRFDLQEYAPNPFYPDIYVPHLVLMTPIPPLKRHYRSFMASINNTLATGDEPLLFDAEINRTLELSHAPDYDFYQDQAMRQASFR